jgi:hypothetical protein
MNLQQLNSGTPNGKLWLNPVVNVLTCNSLVESPATPSRRVFALVNLAGGALPATTTTPCDAVEIACPDVDLLTNTYTAPSACFLQVSLESQITCGAAGSTSDSAFQILVNGILTSIRSRDFLSFPVIAGSANRGVSGVLSLSAGDVVSVRFNNATGGAGPFTYDLFRFSGFVV